MVCSNILLQNLEHVELWINGLNDHFIIDIVNFPDFLEQIRGETVNLNVNAKFLCKSFGWSVPNTCIDILWAECFLFFFLLLLDICQIVFKSLLHEQFSAENLNFLKFHHLLIISFNDLMWPFYIFTVKNGAYTFEDGTDNLEILRWDNKWDFFVKVYLYFLVSLLAAAKATETAYLIEPTLEVGVGTYHEDHDGEWLQLDVDLHKTAG